METHLRLARARGSLQAPNSRVQDVALKFLLLRDDRVVGEDRLNALKRALVNGVSSVERLHNLFPDYFTKEWLAQQAFEAARDETGRIDIDLLDDSKVEWGVASKEEDDEMSRWIASREHKQQSVTAADLESGWV